MFADFISEFLAKFPPEKPEVFISKHAPALPQKWVNQLVELDIPNLFIEDFVQELNGQSDVVIERRLQALETFPFLCHAEHTFSLMFDNCIPDSQEKAADAAKQQLFEAIDTAAPLTGPTQNYLNVLGYHSIGPTHIRRLAKLGVRSNSYFDTLDVAATYMDINHFPSTHAQLETLHTFQKGLSQILKIDEWLDLDGNPEGERHFKEIFKNLYAKFQMSTYQVLEECEKKREISNLHDTIRWVTETVIDPFFHHKSPEEREFASKEARCAMLAQMTCADIARLNVFFHGYNARISRDLEEYDQQQPIKRVESWQPKFSYADETTVPALGEYIIEPLLDRTALKHNASILKNCIYLYAPQCIKGESFCFAIKDRLGNVYSNFEINSKNQLTQHQSLGIHPREDLTQALETYVKANNDGTLQLNPEYGFWEFERKQFTLSEIHGYNPADTDRAKHAARILLGILDLPKTFKEFMQNNEYLNPRPSPQAPGLHL